MCGKLISGADCMGRGRIVTWQTEGKVRILNEETIKRINELARKAKAEGLTQAEAAEQAELRRAYIEAIRMNLRGQLNNIDVREKDGSITNLGEKYGKKGH